jgi:flagellar protein FliO/FliZ
MIIKIFSILLLLSGSLLTLMAFAQESVVEEQLNSQVVDPQSVTAANETSVDAIKQSNATRSPEVGKHVMANMDAGSMILSLLMVLALIIICAFILKRFNLTQQGVSQLRVVTSLSLGTKERIMVVQMGEQQLLLGVTAQKITLLDKLTEPLVETTMSTADLPKNLLSFLSTKKL